MTGFVLARFLTCFLEGGGAIAASDSGATSTATSFRAGNVGAEGINGTSGETALPSLPAEVENCPSGLGRAGW